MLKFCLRLTLLVCFLFTAGTAFAEGFALYEYSARGVALSGAMMARTPDPSAVAYNPALLTRLPGTHASVGVTTVYPQGEMKWRHDESIPNTRLEHSLWHIPNAYFTYQINDDLFFGIGEFSRYGLGFEYPHNWPGRFNIYEVSLTSSSINPVLAWKATDKLSVAAGVEVVYVALDLKKRNNVPLAAANPALPGTIEVDANIQNAEAWGLGANFAMHYQFNDQWAIGAQYRSQVRVHAFGDMEYTHMRSDGVQPGTDKTVYDGMFKDGGANAVVILPDSISAGISYSPIPELSFEVGAIWTRWSTFDSLDIKLPAPINESKTPKDWRNTWRLNAGVEWKATDWLTLRAGYAYDQAPMTAKYADYLVPTANRNIYSGGIGLHWDSWTVDLAYSYINPIRRKYNTKAAMGVYEGQPKDSYTQLFSLSVSYEF